MTKTITFNELRRIKDALPSGSTARIAQELGIEKNTVRNYFGGKHYDDGQSCGMHIEPGPNGGIVLLDDLEIYNRAMDILEEQNIKL